MEVDDTSGQAQECDFKEPNKGNQIHELGTGELTDSMYNQLLMRDHFESISPGRSLQARTTWTLLTPAIR